MNEPDDEREDEGVEEPTLSTEPLALERIVFFSDAVMAIAITLLAIDLRVPDVNGLDDAGFLKQLGDLAPHYFSFVISFAIIALYWIAHHRMFRFIVRWNSTLILLNLLFLFFVVQLPLLNSILGSYGNLSAATAIYAAGLALMGFSSALLWWYAVRARLVGPSATPAFQRYRLLRAASVPVVFTISIPIAFISPPLAQATWLLATATTLFVRPR